MFKFNFHIWLTPQTPGLKQLREYAAKETKELKSPILRLMQIEEKLAKHVAKINV